MEKLQKKHWHIVDEMSVKQKNLEKQVRTVDMKLHVEDHIL